MKRLSMKRVEELAKQRGLLLLASYGYYQIAKPIPNSTAINQLMSGTLRECYYFLQGYRSES